MPTTLGNGTITFGDSTSQSLADGFPNFSSLPGKTWDTWYQAPTNVFVIEKLVGAYMNASAAYVGPSTSSYTKIALVGRDQNYNTWGEWIGFFVRKGSWYYMQSNGDGSGFAGNYGFEYADIREMPAVL